MGEPSPLPSKIIKSISPYGGRLANFSKQYMGSSGVGVVNSKFGTGNIAGTGTHGNLNMRFSDEIDSRQNSDQWRHSTGKHIKSSQEVQILAQENEQLKLVIEEMKSEMERVFGQVQSMGKEIFLVKEESLQLREKGNNLQKEGQDAKSQIAQQTHQLNSKDIQIKENLDLMKNYHQESLDNREKLEKVLLTNRELEQTWSERFNDVQSKYDELVEERESLLNTLAKLKSKAQKWNDSKQKDNFCTGQMDVQLAEQDDLRIRNDKLNVAIDIKNKENERLRSNLNKKMFSQNKVPENRVSVEDKDGNADSKRHIPRQGSIDNVGSNKNAGLSGRNIPLGTQPKPVRNYNLKDDAEFNHQFNNK